MNLKILICFALILGGVLLGCSNAVCGDIMPSSKAAQVPPAPELDSIHMIDRESGWAQNVRMVFRTNDWVPNARAIFRTRNGGESWENVSPAGLGDSVASFFRDSVTAWIATVFDEGTNVTILRTRDGGRSWIRSALHQSHPVL